MEEPSDAQLIEAHLSGDEGSLELLFARHLNAAYGYIARLIGPDLADDAVQEGFVKAWRNLHAFDLKRPFRPWLYRIIHNAALDLLKKKKPASFTEIGSEDGPEIEETIIDESPLPSDLLALAEATDELQGIIRALPLQQRTVLLLYYEEDMTFAEIGESLGESLNTVKSRHHRAVKTLKAVLAGKEHQKDGADRISS